MPPFEFYAWVLGADGGRRRLLARLGPDAVEPIEAFLGQALAYEQGHPASLEGFLHWLCLGTDELKRDPEKARDVVRVTTVHGAKGLEAPIVFLADAGPRGRSAPRPPALERPAARRHRRRAAALARGQGRARRPDRGASSRARTRRELEERRRLLYVALTRARDRLYVTGWLPRRGRQRGGRRGSGRPGASGTSWCAGRCAARRMSSGSSARMA